MWDGNMVTYIWIEKHATIIIIKSMITSYMQMISLWLLNLCNHFQFRDTTLNLYETKHK